MLDRIREALHHLHHDDHQQEIGSEYGPYVGPGSPIQPIHRALQRDQTGALHVVPTPPRAAGTTTPTARHWWRV